MTTLTNFPANASTRAALSTGFVGAMSRNFGSMKASPVWTAAAAISTAIGGSESSVEIDTSGLNRTDLSSLMRTLDSYAQVIPNSGCLIQFARALEAADRAANPNADRLRDA